MHLKQAGFTYSAYGPFTKNKQRIQKFKETGDTNYIYKKELDKAYFQDDMAYGDLKHLAKITNFEKILRDKAFDIAKNPKYDGYQRGLASMFCRCFDKQCASSGINTHANKFAFNNEKLAEELQKTIIRKLKKIKLYSRFKDYIWGADLGDMK